MLNDTLLDAFAHQFYGYGNYTGGFWFIGMEEGGGNTEAQVRNRLEAWHPRGRPELEDLADYHRAIGADHHFSPAATLQTTWAKLIRLLLSAQNQPISTETVRTYQRDKWGRSDGDTCLIELFPLPSPSLDQWLYSDCSTLPYLRSRKEYREAAALWRIRHIQQRIAEQQPRAVIFYGLQYRRWWEAISEIPFNAPNDARFLIGNGKNTPFFMVQHPVAVGVTNRYFEKAGEVLSLKLR